jgi:hypothetical protein
MSHKCEQMESMESILGEKSLRDGRLALSNVERRLALIVDGVQVGTSLAQEH